MHNSFEEETTRQRHNTGTLTPTYLKMTFLLKVRMTQKRMMIGKRQAADTGPTLHNLDLLHL
jgi:hypothetical protein